MLNQRTVRVTQTTNLTSDIKSVGTAIRDWLTPFYTLGGVTTFVITVLTLIDRSGWLVRALTGALILLTIVVCAHAWTKARSTPAATDGAAKPASPKLHTALIIISLFFCVGLLVSEALMHERRQSATAPTLPTVPDAPPKTPEPASAPAAAQAPAAVPTPAPLASTPAAAPAATEAPAIATAPAAPAPAVPANVTSTQESTKKQPVAPAVKAPAATKEEAPKKPNKPQPNDSAPAHAAEPARPKPAKAPSAGAAMPARCSEIMVQFSAGRSLSDGDKQYLETSCR